MEKNPEKSTTTGNVPKSFDKLNKDLIDAGLIVDSDILIDTSDNSTDSNSGGRKKRKAQKTTATNKWPTADKGVIPYTLAPSFGKLN